MLSGEERRYVRRSPVIASRSPLQEPFELGHSFSEVPELIGRLLALGLGPRGSVPTR